MPNKDRIIEAAWIIVRIAIVFNWVALAAIAIALIYSWIFPLAFTSFLHQAAPEASPPSLVAGVRFELLIGILTSIAALWLLTSLLNILKSARQGEPFSDQTTDHLQTMAWALLAFQMLDIPAGLSVYFIPGLPAAVSDSSISVGGWIAVLMLFVLARVFATGAEMRKELEGTV